MTEYCLEIKQNEWGNKTQLETESKLPNVKGRKMRGVLFGMKTEWGQ